MLRRRSGPEDECVAEPPPTSCKKRSRTVVGKRRGAADPQYHNHSAKAPSPSSRGRPHEMSFQKLKVHQAQSHLNNKRDRSCEPSTNTACAQRPARARAGDAGAPGVVEYEASTGDNRLGNAPAHYPGPALPKALAMATGATPRWNTPAEGTPEARPRCDVGLPAASGV